MTENYEKMCVWINEEDFIDIRKLSNKVVDVYSKRAIYGMCFILSKDLTKEQLEHIFNV